MINNFTCIIVDDEPQAIEVLAETLHMLYKNIDIIATYASWNKALEGLRANSCDILFMDISIQDKNGMDLLRGIPDLQSEVVFITAHSSYALNAFKFPVAGYILKPIDDIDLTTTVDRCITRIVNKRLAAKSGMQGVVSNKIGIPDNKAIHYIPINDILYLEAVNTYTRVVTKDTEILSSYNIGRFKAQFEDYMFFQVHRSYIVNLNAIRKYETSGYVVMENNKEIPVSKNVKEQFLKLFVRIKTEQKKTS